MNYDDVTPVMKQYLEAKRDAGDALLLFRMGDFYELFYEDAHKAADTLGIAVTSRDRNKGADATPMAGFPYHQLEAYLARLISAGYKVAVCEQVEDPKKAKTIVKRKLTRIITPGTVLDETILDPRTSNFLAAVVARPEPRMPSEFPMSQEEEVPVAAEPALVIPVGQQVGLAWAELSTGQFYAATLSGDELFDQIGRISPSELLIPESLKGIMPDWITEHIMLTVRPEWTFAPVHSQELLLKQFGVKTLEGFGFNEQSDAGALRAAGGIIDYLIETQKQSLEHIESLLPYRVGKQLDIDQSSCRSLEIVQTLRDGRRDGSLLSVMDRCQTPMGSRLLYQWLTYPLTDVNQIIIRQDAVAELAELQRSGADPGGKLRGIHDLERILAKVIQHRAVPRDLVFIDRTLRMLPAIQELLSDTKSSLLQTLLSHLDPLTKITEELSAALVPDGPVNYREGGFIQNGYHAQLDEFRQLQTGGKQWLAKYQAQEIERTGISNLKIGYTSVFGYFIEITRTNSDRIPENYVRKQTLKNAERYITEELKVYEEKVLTAEDQAKALEMELLSALTEKVIAVRSKIQRNAGVLAHLDALVGLAILALTRGYIRPKIVEEPILEIRGGRHPVLDIMGSGAFVPNDAFCDSDHGTFHLITGPNMAGKSTFIRQIALLTIMAQVGSFIPADEAKIGVADRIFARVGASDELTRGQSTFMVEMVETARILNGATNRSLVILDEIGRGTSTYDGISLAWAIVEYLHERIGARTFFATHYHELTGLADTYEGINNLNVAVREWNDEIIFLHKIIPGATDKSYGIHVARLAGVPLDVVHRSREILTELEASHVKAAQDVVRNVLQNTSFERDAEPAVSHDPLKRKLKKKTASGAIQFSLFGPEDHPVVDELRSLDIGNMTPVAAITLLEKWKKYLD